MSDATTGTQDLTFRYRLEGLALRTMLDFFRLLGLPAASAVGGWLGRTIGPLIGVSRKADRNLQIVMPELTAQERKAIIKAMWENLGRTMGEYAHLDKYAAAALDPTNPLITLEGMEHARAAQSGGKGAIFISGHFTNWEVLPLCLSEWKSKVGEVYRAANNPAANAVILNLRQTHIAPTQFPKGVEGARGIVRHLKSGGLIAMLTDQKLGEGLDATFMGHPAKTAAAAAQFSLKFGAPLVPVSIQRDGHCFTITFHPPLSTPLSGNKAEDTMALTQAMNDWLGIEVRRTPGHWLWLHNRWGFKK